jgi:hypothetical protein
MAELSAKQVAEKIGTDGRTLRRFLRQDTEYRNPGSGSRWLFTDADVDAIADRFTEWQGRPKQSTRKPLITDEPGLSYTDAKDPAKVKAMTEARVDRLEAALKARGLHISQMREREGWAARV